MTNLAHKQLEMWNFQRLPAKAADEEALPFKMIHSLSHELGLRVFGYPESTHACWNDCRNSIRRTGLQYCLLLSALLANCSHGPYSGGKNRQTLEEAAEDLQDMHGDSFHILVDEMMADMRCDPDDPRLPKSPAELPGLPCVKNLPPYAGSSIFMESEGQ